MINIRQATEIDQSLWDDYVLNHNEHSPYHLFAWKNAVLQAYQHKSHYLIAEEDNTNDINSSTIIVGILPLVIFKKPLSSPSLCALPFCDVGGALANDELIKQQLISASKNVANNIKANVIELRSIAPSTTITEDDGQHGSEKVSMLMSLPADSDTLFAGFKSKLRSQIRKAEKNGLHYKLGSEKVLLNDFYQVFSHNMRALGSPVHSKQWFIALLECYQANMIISVVYKDNLPIGAGIVLIAGNKAAIPWASTKAEFNRLSPNMMLYWSLLKHLSDHDICHFDFGRSSYGEGTFKFKQQWGAQPVPLNWQVLTLPSGNIVKDEANAITSSNTNKLRAIVENVWRKLPLNMTVFLGPKIRKYISL